MLSKKPNSSLVFEPEPLERIEDFPFGHRFPTRSSAIKWLLEWALEQCPQPPAPKARVAVGD